MSTNRILIVVTRRIKGNVLYVPYKRTSVLSQIDNMPVLSSTTTAVRKENQVNLFTIVEDSCLLSYNLQDICCSNKLVVFTKPFTTVEFIFWFFTWWSVAIIVKQDVIKIYVLLQLLHNGGKYNSLSSTFTLLSEIHDIWLLISIRKCLFIVSHKELGSFKRVKLKHIINFF